jgi:hypothetical protein
MTRAGGCPWQAGGVVELKAHGSAEEGPEGDGHGGKPGCRVGNMPIHVVLGAVLVEIAVVHAEQFAIIGAAIKYGGGFDAVLVAVFIRVEGGVVVVAVHVDVAVDEAAEDFVFEPARGGAGLEGDGYQACDDALSDAFGIPGCVAASPAPVWPGAGRQRPRHSLRTAGSITNGATRGSALSGSSSSSR